MKTTWLAVAVAAAVALTGSAHADPIDPYLWLEEVASPKAMDWVKGRNAVTVKALASSPEFDKMQGQILEVLDSDARIPFVRRMGPFLYNFWKDKQHPRGLFRRTTLEEYRKPQPAWELLLDVDALGKAEKENWVWEGFTCLKPEYRSCMLILSRGGADANVLREYDLKTKAFVKNGFVVPEAKSDVSWKDPNTLYLGSDFGAGSMTKSGYPRIVKEWKRGTPLASAKQVYEGKADDVAVSLLHDATPGFERDFARRQIETYASETFLVGKSGALTRIDVPRDAELDVEREWLLVQTRSPWTVGGKTYEAGSLVATRLEPYLAGKRELTLLFQPTPTTSLAGFSWTKTRLILTTLEDVVSHIEVLTPQPGVWKREPLGGAPELSTIEAFGADQDNSDEYFLTVTGYLNPTTLSRGVLGAGPPQSLKQSPAFFDGTRHTVRRYFAASKDGTRVPYFVVSPPDQKNDQTPTLLYGYGGFEISLQPWYDGGMGRAWLSRGGVFVVANIRGGGEYGPRWHQAALKQNRLRAYEDFAAVAQDLVTRKITSQSHLGMEGGSNGGLLAGNMLTLYPRLFAAVVSEVPLLDMKRYTHLSAGASWMAEYGDPDVPAEWAFLQTFSPYHNAKKGVKYPPVLFTTSTRDDRVGPVHARKMTAKMLDLGSDVTFYENIEGGHGGAADHKEAAFMSALAYTFLWNHLR